MLSSVSRRTHDTGRFASMPRQRQFTDSEQKRKKRALDRTYYRSTRGAPVVINIGTEGDRWVMVQSQTKADNNAQVAKILLDSYFGKTDDSAGKQASGSAGNQASGSAGNQASTSTPNVKRQLVPYLSEVSSIRSSDSTESAKISGVERFSSEETVERQTPKPALSRNEKHDPHDITQDNIDVDVLLTDIEDIEDEECLVGITYEDDLMDADYLPSQLNITYGDKTIDYNALPIVGDDDDDYEEELETIVEDVNESIEEDHVGATLDDKLVICFVSKVMELANMDPPKKCRKCQGAVVSKYKLCGTGIKINWVCSNNHQVSTWNSQPYINRVQAADFLLSANILLSGNNFGKVQKLFTFLNLGCVSSATFYAVQANYCVPVILKFWEDEQRKILNELRGKELVLLGDGQNDSPGHCAQYLNYNIMDQDSGYLLVCNVVDKRETGLNSPKMEMVAFKRALQFLEEDGQAISEVVTDGHLSIKSYMVKEKNSIKHSNDIWHGAKSVTKKLNMATQKRENKELIPWAKKVVNHFWYCARHCETNANVFRATWFGVLHHVVDEHEWLIGNGLIEPRCQHSDLDDDPREWLQKSSTAFTTLRNIVFDRNLLKNIPYFVNFRHTGMIETFHSFKLMYASKRCAYSPPVYKARCLLAALDYNAHKDRQQLTDKNGETRLNRKFCKRSNYWSAFPVKERKTYAYIKPMLKLMLEARLIDKQPLQRRRQLDVEDPRNIAPTIAAIPPPSTDHIRKKQKTRF